jgi:hypothetical protein
LGHGLAELAKLDQGGVGIMTEGALGAAGELEKHRVVGGEKAEITGTAATAPTACVSLHVRFLFPIAWAAAVCPSGRLVRHRVSLPPNHRVNQSAMMCQVQERSADAGPHQSQ